MTITGNLASEGYDIRLSKFTSSKELTPAAYERQFKRSNIVVENGLPFAKSLKAPLSVQHSSELTPEEVLIWKLASILFDKHSDDIPTVIPADQKRHYGARIQKDRLSKFWKSICKDDALHAVGASRTAEERAIHYLSMGAIVEACDALIDGKDFRLATLISQIGGDKIMQQDMVQQIKEWRRLNVISEMSESIRALYEMLAGNVCLCEGRQGPIEDRASTFTISQKYNLTWSRSFGLRLWYAIADDEPLEAAVKSYLHDLSGPETSKPKPWFLVKHGSNPPWPDSDPEGREDVIWGILKLFTYHKDGKFTTKLSDVVAPENVRGNPIDNRLSWELYFALLPYLPQHQSSEAADRLTTSFAAELESANHRMWAIFILLHLHNAEQRQVAIRDILARQAAFIDIDNAKTQDILFNQFHIPEAWIYEAKALFSRAVEQDRITELRYLQRAGNWTEAHNVICRTVAPKAIIERDHHTLSKILDEFEKAEKPYTWRTGGAVYQDYLKLLSTKDPVEHHKLIKRLLRSIPDMANTGPGAANKKRKGTVETGSENEGFLRSIAIKEMSWVVGDMLLQDQDAVSILSSFHQVKKPTANNFIG